MRWQADHREPENTLEGSQSAAIVQKSARQGPQWTVKIWCRDDIGQMLRIRGYSSFGTRQTCRAHATRRDDYDSEKVSRATSTKRLSPLARFVLPLSQAQAKRHSNNMKVHRPAATARYPLHNSSHRYTCTCHCHCIQTHPVLSPAERTRSISFICHLTLLASFSSLSQHHHFFP